MKKQNFFQQKSNQVQRLIDIYAERDTVKTWIQYSKLEEKQKTEIKNQWNEYLQSARKTRAYEIYSEISHAVKTTNHQLVLDLYNENEQFVSSDGFIPTPVFKYDPIWLEQCWDVSQYSKLNDCLSEVMQQALDAGDYDTYVRGEFK